MLRNISGHLVRWKGIEYPPEPFKASVTEHLCEGNGEFLAVGYTDNLPKHESGVTLIVPRIVAELCGWRFDLVYDHPEHGLVQAL